MPTKGDGFGIDHFVRTSKGQFRAAKAIRNLRPGLREGQPQRQYLAIFAS